jgi:hypothetical protein
MSRHGEIRQETIRNPLIKHEDSKGGRLRWDWRRNPSTAFGLAAVILWPALVFALPLGFGIFAGRYLPLYLVSRVHLIVGCFINIF